MEGIFRLNGSAKRIKDLQEIFDSPERYGKGLDWTGYTVHDAANVLRRYLNQLPEPIVPLEFYERFREPLRVYQKQVQDETQVAEADKFDHSTAVVTYQRLIVELPPLNKQLLLYILDLLAVFASKSDQNRMTSANLSAIFQPGMLSHPQHDMSPEEYKLSQDVLIFLIENQDHFLVGMSGTAADEQTRKEVEAGPPSRSAASTAATAGESKIRRSASGASNTTEGNRKLDTLRRNVSVSSRTSRNSNTAQSPGTPTSMSGGGVHRSNTLPSKMGPVLTSARYTRAGESGSGNPTALAVSHHSSRSTSRAPSLREETEKPRPSQATSASPSKTYEHTSTRGPIPVTLAEHLGSSEARPQEKLDTPASPPTQAATPTRERKLSSFFTKSPPPEGEQNQTRQPNRLRKKRIPGSASISAQSSSNSLYGGPSELNLESTLGSEVKREQPSMDVAVGDTTPKPPTTSTLNRGDTPSDSTQTLGEAISQPNTDTSLRPHRSRTPSMNSRSSFTDQSDLDQPDDGTRSDHRDRRRSWRFHRSGKRSSEQVGLGLASPPLVATNPSAERSSVSIGSGPLQTNDPANQPLSLDAGVQSNAVSSAEPEKRSLFGKFKAKVAQVRDGVKDDRERAKSPNQFESDLGVSQPLSPNLPSETINKPSGDVPSETPKEETVRSPISPLPGAGLPPSIPEEPHSPEAPSAVPVFDQKKDPPVPGTTAAPTSEPEPALASEIPKETAEKESST